MLIPMIVPGTTRNLARPRGSSGLGPLFLLFVVAFLFLHLGPAQATTKGLNQIVTPDLQPPGILSLSYQQQDPYIGLPSQVQVEYGVTKRFEFAVFQSLSSRVEVLNAEIGLVQQGPYLLSTGFGNWTTRGNAPLPYLIGGYYAGLHKSMLGVARVGNQWQSILGWGYQVHPRVLLQLDYQSGSGNSLTGGFTYNITTQLQVNPAIYMQNDAPHHLHGYIVLTWNIPVGGL